MNTEMNTEDITSDLEKSFRAKNARTAYSRFMNELSRLVERFNEGQGTSGESAFSIDNSTPGTLQYGSTHCQYTFVETGASVTVLIRFGWMGKGFEVARTPEYEFLLEVRGTNILNMKALWKERTLSNLILEDPEQLAAFCFRELFKRSGVLTNGV